VPAGAFSLRMRSIFQQRRPLLQWTDAMQGTVHFMRSKLILFYFILLHLGFDFEEEKDWPKGDSTLCDRVVDLTLLGRTRQSFPKCYRHSRYLRRCSSMLLLLIPSCDNTQSDGLGCHDLRAMVSRRRCQVVCPYSEYNPKHSYHNRLVP
jgi:hypothetical protein